MKPRADVFFLLLLLLAPTLSLASEKSSRPAWDFNFNVMIGKSDWDQNTWDPLHRQDALGLQFDVQPKKWPVSLCSDFLFSYKTNTVKDVKLELLASEVGFGARKYVKVFRNLEMYGGGGPAWIRAERRTSIQYYFLNIPSSEIDTGFGYWVGGGLQYVFFKHVNVGFQWRKSKATVTLSGQNVDAGGEQTGILFGFGFR